MVVIEVTTLGITARCDACGSTARTEAVRLLDFEHREGCTGPNLFSFSPPTEPG